jgi:ubiquinone biosynthesis protein UbiJ
MSLNSAALATFEQLLNQILRLDPESSTRLAEMFGQVIQIDITGLGFSLYLIPEPHGIALLSHYEGEPDCLLRGSPWDLATLNNDRNSTDQLFQGAVTIEGDTALAQKFGDLIQGLDIDLEDQLSRLTGDIAAHEIGNLVRGALNWGKRVNQTAEQNLTEYLQEELRLLPGPYELSPFLSDVDHLRDDLERLEARIQRLERSVRAGDKGS